MTTQTDIHVSSGIQIYDTGVQAGKDGSCLRPSGHCDAQVPVYRAKIVLFYVKTEYLMWNNGNSGYSNYILNTGHTYRTRMDTIDIIKMWSSGQRSWLQIQRSQVRFPALQDFMRSNGSGTGSTQPREDN
jgi:hypothetical protein